MEGGWEREGRVDVEREERVDEERWMRRGKGGWMWRWKRVDEEREGRVDVEREGSVDKEIQKLHSYVGLKMKMCTIVTIYYLTFLTLIRMKVMNMTS